MVRLEKNNSIGIFWPRKKSKEDESIQVAVLITLLGHEGLRIYETFTWTILPDVPEDATKIKGVLAKFENHFEPSKSQTFARYKFLTHHKQES